MPCFLLTTAVGCLARQVFGNVRLKFPEEEDAFRLQVADPAWEETFATRDGFTIDGTAASHAQETTFHPREERHATEKAHLHSVDIERQSLTICEPETAVKSGYEQSQKVGDSRGNGDRIIIVGWYGNADPSNPINWPKWKKAFVYFTINFCSFVVYMASAIYTPSQTGVESAFGVTATVSSLGLGMFVLGYGVGPMLWSPLSEMPAVGRNAPYLATLAVFILISIPTALSNNIGTLLALRFLQGFFGSPVLSTGGASLSDISDSYTRSYALYSWAISSLAGPSIGTVISGFTVPVLGWRWSLWEILLTTSPAFLLLLFLPETSAPTILYRRAKRIRVLTGKDYYLAESEIGMAQITMVDRFYRSLIIPWRINLLDPSIMFTSIYCGIIYAIFYSMFEFFPLVYGNIYGMSPGQIGLVFLCNIVAVILAGIPYFAYIHCIVHRSLRDGGTIAPERRLFPAIFASILIPTGIFLFGWTSRLPIHWIVPTIGAVFATAGFIIILQSIFVYIALAYPRYAASLFGGNGFVKALVAFAGIVWSHPLYSKLGLADGMSLLGALCAACVSGIFILYYFGEKLRSLNRFAA
ncbi:major facilitator superfamily domain-containing protein [Lipomyces kononenkoae]|uniref:Major facilitator superfamily domain-containing protein n=1 Tax=Lipomyces kononenkoae TaxID=34357 RepID=A0ACC3T3U2_LIPKO